LIAADATLSRRLQVQLGAEVVFLYRIRLIEGVPMAIERSYLPHELCPGILSHDFSKNSLYDVLASAYSRRPDHAEQVIEASLATAEVCQRLELTAPAVVFLFHRETRMATGEVLEYVESEMRADRFRLYTNLKLATMPEENMFRKILSP
jgi:GntR family transcriptional regulator